MDAVRDEALNMDIDLRLRPIWDLITAVVDESDLDGVMSLLRAAYGFGYVDALREEEAGVRGRLCRDHGFALP